METYELKGKLKEMFSLPVSIESVGISKFKVCFKDKDILLIRGGPCEIYISYEVDYEEKEHRIYLQMILNLLRQNNIKTKITNKPFFKSRSLFDKIFKSKDVKVVNYSENKNCPETINFFYRIIENIDFCYMEGILIYFNSKFIGVYKKAPMGNSLLLGLEDEIFEKYCLVTLSKNLEEELDEIETVNCKQWTRVNLVGKSIKISTNKHNDYRFVNNVKKLRDDNNFKTGISAYRGFMGACSKLNEKESKFSGEFFEQIDVDKLG